MPHLFSRFSRYWAKITGWFVNLSQSRLTVARQSLLSAIDAGDEFKIKQLIPHCRGLNWSDHSNQTSWLSFAPLQKLLIADLDFSVKLRLLRVLLSAGADPLMVCPSWEVKQVSPSSRWEIRQDPSGPNWRKIMSDEPDWRLALSFALVRDSVLAKNAMTDIKGGSFIPTPLLFANHSLVYLECMQEFCPQNLFKLRIDSYGCGLLHYAVLGDSPHIVKRLLQSGADLQLANDFLEIPYDIAKDPAVLSAIRAWELSRTLPEVPFQAFPGSVQSLAQSRVVRL